MRIYISNISHGELLNGQSEISFDAPKVINFSPSNKELAKVLREVADLIDAPSVEDKELF